MPRLRTRVASRPSDTNGALQRRTSKPAAPESLTRHEAARRLSALATALADGARMVVPVALLQRQATVRVPELLPIRYGRMAVSAFTYFRGAALPMASDLADTPRTGLVAQSCGDAHMANFGLFASAERSWSLTSMTSTRPFLGRGSGT